MPDETPLEQESVDHVRIRFAGDSGDGMQLAGARFTDASAIFGNDLATLPSYPAEIRAPAGSIAGVSSFQVHIADSDILTPGDNPDVLVAMNPAALKANLADLAPAGTIIVNRDAFDERNLARAGVRHQPAARRVAPRLHGHRGPHGGDDPGGGQGHPASAGAGCCAPRTSSPWAC